jgi:hypothetical protein
VEPLVLHRTVSEDDLSFPEQHLTPLTVNNYRSSPSSKLEWFLSPFKSMLTVTLSSTLMVTLSRREEDKLPLFKLKFLLVASTRDSWILRGIGCWDNWNGGSRSTTCAGISSYGQR